MTMLGRRSVKQRMRNGWARGGVRSSAHQEDIWRRVKRHEAPAATARARLEGPGVKELDNAFGEQRVAVRVASAVETTPAVREVGTGQVGQLPRHESRR